MNDEIEAIESGERADPYKLSWMWTANNDARNYIILGDPAVRLPLALTEKKPARRLGLDLDI